MTPEISKAIDAYNNGKQKLIDDVQNQLQPAFDNLFKSDSGRIKGFAWVQYTDYFNDGDPCYFSVHVDYYNLDFDIGCGFECYGDIDCEFDSKEKEFVDKVATLLSSIPEEVLEQIYGDHKKIVVVKNDNGPSIVDVQGYSNHD